MKSSGLGSLLEWEARTGNMSFEISVISIGAIFILLLLMASICAPGQRGKSEKDYMNQNNSGIYLRAVYFCLGKPLPLKPLCFTSVSPNLVTSGLLQSLCQFLSCSSSPTLPGPPSLLFIGNMKELTHDHLPIHLTHLAQRYGKIYRLKCGNTSNDA